MSELDVAICFHSFEEYKLLLENTRDIIRSYGYMKLKFIKPMLNIEILLSQISKNCRQCNSLMFVAKLL